MSNKALFGQKLERLWIFLATSFAILMVLVLSETPAYGETFTGKAVNRQGVLEYVEHHTVKYENGDVAESQTIYYDSEKKKIGDLVSEYSHGPQFGSYDFRDLRSQYEDGAKVAVDRIQVYRRENPKDDVEAKYLPREPDQIVGQGFHQFVRYNLEAIAAGRIFHVCLVFPSRLKQYHFRIRKRKLAGDTLYIRLEFDNWFLRLFAPHVDAEYDLRTRRLLRYEGISNLADASGKHKKVTITYSYES